MRTTARRRKRTDAQLLFRSVQCTSGSLAEGRFPPFFPCKLAHSCYHARARSIPPWDRREPNRDELQPSPATVPAIPTEGLSLHVARRRMDAIRARRRDYEPGKLASSCSDVRSRSGATRTTVARLPSASVEVARAVLPRLDGAGLTAVAASALVLVEHAALAIAVSIRRRSTT